MLFRTHRPPAPSPYWPPATSMNWPVILDAAGEAKNTAAAAQSIGLPVRPNGTREPSCSSACSSVMCIVSFKMSVTTTPGAMQFTVI